MSNTQRPEKQRKKGKTKAEIKIIIKKKKKKLWFHFGRVCIYRSKSGIYPEIGKTCQHTSTYKMVL